MRDEQIKLVRLGGVLIPWCPKDRALPVLTLRREREIIARVCPGYLVLN